MGVNKHKPRTNTRAHPHELKHSAVQVLEQATTQTPSCVYMFNSTYAVNRGLWSILIEPIK